MCHCPCQLWASKGSAVTCFWGYLLKKMRLKELFRVRRNLDVFESCEDGIWVPAGCSCVEVLGDGSPAQGKWLLWGRGAGFCAGGCRVLIHGSVLTPSAPGEVLRHC